MRRGFRFASLVTATFLFAAGAFAQTVETGSKASLTIRGFLSATAFAQDQTFAFGNGQNAEWPLPPEATTDRWFHGGDVRNTRLTLAFTGPKVAGNVKIGGALEMDFFGGFNGSGAFSEQQPTPRLRLGYADLIVGRTTIRIGQFWSPLFGNVAVSNSHIAFPLGYGSGDVGWRFPGIFVYQPLTPKDAAVSAELQLAVMRGSWDGPPSGSAGNTNSLTGGNAGWPQFEGRLNLGGKSGNATWSVYLVGHWDRKDLSGVNANGAPGDLTGSIGELGAKLQLGGFLVQGNVYTGKACGQQFCSLAQFGDIQSTGGWLQAGYDFTPNWGVFLFGALDDPDDADALAAATTPAGARLRNEIESAMLRWRTGPYSLGLEYLHAKLRTGPTHLETKGNQVALSALYNF